MGKKKGKKKGKPSKYLDLDDARPNHNGFAPGGEPIKVICCQRDPVCRDIPEHAERRAELGTDPAKQPVKVVRVGEHLYCHISDLKERIEEVTRIHRDRQFLFHRAADTGPEGDKGRPIREISGWREDWPWPADLRVVELHDELKLETYHIGEKSAERIAAEKAKLEAFQKELESNPELRKRIMEKKDRELLERQNAGLKNKKSKKGKGKGGKPMNPKEAAKLAEKEAKRKARDDAEKQEEDDWHRNWPENEVFMLVKVDGLSRIDAFKPHLCQQSAADRRKPGFAPPPWSRPRIIQNSEPTGLVVPKSVDDDAEGGDSASSPKKGLPPIRGSQSDQKKPIRGASAR